MGRIKEVFYRLKDIVVDLLEDGISENEIDDYIKANLKDPNLYGFYINNKQAILDEIELDMGKDPEDLDEAYEPTNSGLSIEEEILEGLETKAIENDYDYSVIAVHLDGKSLLIETTYKTYSVGMQLKRALQELGYKVKRINKYLAGDYINYEVELVDEISQSWIDPAGGTHYGNDEDPAQMYEVLVGKEKQQERFIDLRGPSGNAFVILGMAKNLADQLKKADPKKYNWETIQAEMTAGNFNNLVHTFDRYFGDYVTIYGADILDEAYIMPLLSEGCNCNGIKKPKPRPRPSGHPRPKRSEELLEDNSGDARKIANFLKRKL